MKLVSAFLAVLVVGIHGGAVFGPGNCQSDNGCYYKCGVNGKIPSSLLPLILPTILNDNSECSCGFNKQEVLAKLMPILNVLLTNCNNACNCGGSGGGCGY